MKDEDQVDFGYQHVKTPEKANLVRHVFDSVANRYDLMNDLMSLGVHRYWKRWTIDQAGVVPGDTVLDLAGGTGDLAKRLKKIVGPQGVVVLADINYNMLNVGRDRFINEGLLDGIEYVQTNAEKLAFPENTFHCITMAFGLRNVTDKAAALASMYQTLKPGGCLLVLEFSKPTNSVFKKVYDAYSFKVLPQLGKWVTKDADSYQYLVESIRMHPDQETLKQMMETAGFETVSYQNLAGGIVALHRGVKAS